MTQPTEESTTPPAEDTLAMPSGLAKELQKKIGARTDQAKQSIEVATDALVKQALANQQLVSSNALETVQRLIANIDQKLTEQVNLVLHAPEFQSLEGSWRGLRHLVNNTATDDMLKIRVLNVSKKELKKSLLNFKGAAWDHSPLFKKIYDAEYDMLGGAPYGCIVADYYFNHEGEDVDALGELSKIGAAGHVPIISAADCSLFGLDSWQQMDSKRSISPIFTKDEYADWRSLRDSPDSRYLGLTLPRFLARRPYGAKSTPVDEFAFEEDTAGASGSDPSKFTWANAAYAMGANITRAFKDYGWCSRIRGVESGGIVEGLPTHTFKTDDGMSEMTCPTEIGIGDRRNNELSTAGFIPLTHIKKTDKGVFMAAQSLQKPIIYDREEATANSRLSARLPYLFAASRFAHYMKSIGQTKIGGFMSAEAAHEWLNRWITNYVDGNPATSDEATKARKPLAAARVDVTEDESNPGFYSATCFLRPHFQLENLHVTFSVVAKLPKPKA